MMSSCELDGSEGPKFNRKCRKEKDADHISFKNEDTANESFENIPTTGQGPSLLLTPVFMFRKSEMLVIEFVPLLFFSCFFFFFPLFFLVAVFLKSITKMCGQLHSWTVPRLCVVPSLVLGLQFNPFFYWFET